MANYVGRLPLCEVAAAPDENKQKDEKRRIPWAA
jgi:hypothetical protein